MRRRQAHGAGEAMMSTAIKFMRAKVNLVSAGPKRYQMPKVMRPMPMTVGTKMLEI
jgi:hypothetical protein